MVDAGASVAAVLAAGAERLAGAGVSHPVREARWIWQSVAGGDALALAMQVSECAPSPLALRFEEAIERRAAGEPLAYVTGSAAFRHLTVRSDRRALIPRPETEGLVDVALQCVRSGIAADIGTGTGVIALALATEGEFDAVYGVDLSREALTLAAENGRVTGADVTWLTGDLVAPLGGIRCDLLVSNPPYVTVAEYQRLDPSVRNHEPAMALVGGDDGLAIIRRLLDEGHRAVAPGGWVVLEIDERRADATRRLAVESGWNSAAVHDDMFGRPRYLSAQRGGE